MEYKIKETANTVCWEQWSDVATIKNPNIKESSLKLATPEAIGINMYYLVLEEAPVNTSPSIG